MPWPKTGATQYHAQLGLPDRGRAIKGLVVRYVVWLESMKGMNLRAYARCACLFPCCGQDGYRAKVPQHFLKTQ